jgi:hypothetical protein
MVIRLILIAIIQQIYEGLIILLMFKFKDNIRLFVTVKPQN